MCSQVYRIAFVPFDAFGHMNACLALARDVQERGHKCVLITNQNWKDLIAKHGFENRIYTEEHKSGDKGSWNEFMAGHGHVMKLSSFEKIKSFNRLALQLAINDVKLFNDKLKNILNDFKPDAIVVDSFMTIPAVTCAGVPWIDLCSSNPLCYMDDERLPPGSSGKTRKIMRFILE